MLILHTYWLCVGILTTYRGYITDISGVYLASRVRRMGGVKTFRGYVGVPQAEPRWRPCATEAEPRRCTEQAPAQVCAGVCECACALAHKDTASGTQAGW